ncbi:MAG: hypothetical protein FWC84_06680 [Alphaproteobacteria bacterium]|nr:hypothetical protein [Alphaproteobacteria bacterium]
MKRWLLFLIDLLAFPKPSAKAPASAHPVSRESSILSSSIFIVGKIRPGTRTESWESIDHEERACCGLHGIDPIRARIAIPALIGPALIGSVIGVKPDEGTPPVTWRHLSLSNNPESLFSTHFVDAVNVGHRRWSGCLV